MSTTPTSAAQAASLGAPGLAAAIPAFEAARWIEDVVRRTLRQVPRVLVIDDGSSDGTAEVARQAGAEVVSLPENRGKGAALRTAFETLFARGYDAVITLDADGQHVPEEIPHLVDAWRGGADLVLGTRARFFADMGGLRRISNSLSSKAISILAGCPLDDVQTGFRLYTRELIAATGFPESRFDAESAVVVRAGRLGMRISGVPVALAAADGRGSSHYRALVDGLRIGWAVVRARFGGRPRIPGARG